MFLASNNTLIPTPLSSPPRSLALTAPFLFLVHDSGSHHDSTRHIPFIMSRLHSSIIITYYVCFFTGEHNSP